MKLEYNVIRIRALRTMQACPESVVFPGVILVVITGDYMMIDR